MTGRETQPRDGESLPAKEGEHLSNNIKSLNTSLLDNWIYLYSNHSTNAIFTRKDINALTKWNYINTDTKNSIINFSDNTSTSTPTFKTFMKDLDANKAGTANDNFNLFMDGFPEITEGFVGHKLGSKTAEEYKIFYDGKKERVGELLSLSDNVKAKTKKWLDYSEGNAKRKNYFELGDKFEKTIKADLTKTTSPVYQALLAQITDLPNRTILYQAQFCINTGSNNPIPNYIPCNSEGQFFIADFACVKPIKGNQDITIGYDVIILDTKLSSGTDFTPNQTTAKGLDYYLLKAFPSQVNGSTYTNIEVGAKVDRAKKSVPNHPFYKIISDGGDEPKYSNLIPLN